MVTIADLISSASSNYQEKCDLVVDSAMPVRDVLARMEESGGRYVGIELESSNTPLVLSRQDLLEGLLRQVDQAGEKLGDLQKQITDGMSVELDLVRENTRSMADIEKNKLEVAIDYMTEGLVIISPDGNISKCNPAAMKFFSLDGSESVERFTEVVDDYGFRELFSGSVKNGVDNWGRFKMKSPSDAIIQIRWTEMVDETGDLVGNLVMLRDITDELAGDRAKTEFIAAITHELRTPLTIIQNTVSNILAGVSGKLNTKLRGYLETIQGDCKRFGVLVSDLLDMSKLEAGDMSLNRQIVDLSEAIGTSIAVYSADAKARDIEIVQPVGNYFPPVYADRARIDQVLSNFIANAVKFSLPGGKVIVGSYQDESDVVTCVQDSGSGISEVNQKQLFNKFHQIGRQAGAGYRGMGLGLSICKGILEMHGGKVWVESQEGHGSKFYFSLPKIDPSIVLNKHLDTLAKTTATTGQEFALIIVNFEIDQTDQKEYQQVIGTTIKELLEASGNFLTEKTDLALETSDNEVVFAVSDARKNRLDTVMAEITKVVENIKNNSFNGLLLVPKIGLGVYPADSNDVIEIKNLAREKAVKMFNKG
jgi:signal transduction histidine kinase